VPRRFAILTVSAVLLLAPLLVAAEETLRDPTRPYSARAAVVTSSGGGGGTATSSFRVTAIFTSDMRRIAVVNGRRVAEGDRVDGATVVEIHADRLRLDHHGKSITSRVLPYGFRK
jgi:hypothetical protein